MQTPVVAPGTSGPSLGEWLAGIVAALTILGIVFRLGGVVAEAKNLKSDLAEKLSGIADTLARINTFMDESMRLRADWAAFRSLTESTQAEHGDQIAALRADHDKTLHRVKNGEQAHALLAQRVEDHLGKRSA